MTLSLSDRINRKRKTDELIAEIAGEAKGEYALHKSIVDALERFRLPGVIWFHCPSGIHASAKAMIRMKPLGFIAGVADLCISIPGNRFCFMEIKTPSGRLSEHQEAFLAGMERNGHRTAVVRSVDEAMFVLRDWGAIRAARRMA